MRTLLAEQARSGLSVKAFAERVGLSPQTLYWWRGELRRREEARSSVDLVEIEVSAEPSSEFEVRVRGDELRVLVPASFDPEHLLRLLATLRRC